MDFTIHKRESGQNMSLNEEWRNRVNNWKNELKNHFYHPLGKIDFVGFVTKEQLSVEEAAKGDFVPMPEGTPWGAKWEYGWFKGKVKLPPEAAGKRIVMAIDVGGESAVYVNGVNAGAKDEFHNEITLTTCSNGSEEYEIMVESYAGHGVRVCHAPPVPPGRLTVPEPDPKQVKVGASSFGIWDEEAYQLWLDVDTLYHVRENLDPNSLRVSEIDRGLKDFTLIVDFELPYEERIKTFAEGRKRLKPLLECVNGTTAPRMYMFGHSHIDVAWLWPLAETERKCTRTFATQIALMEEYPEYKMLQSQPHLYWMVKNHYPKLYERIREKVKNGQFIPDGGMWVEADTNITGGESLIRQFIHGKRFFRDEFGVENEFLWLPDVFGYSGALPQIMKGCGIKYFSTQKIFWAYGGCEPFPYNNFIWEGIDGTEILASLHFDYCSHTDPGSVIKRWNNRVQKDDMKGMLFPFGYGDGGGGATRDHLEYVRRIKDLEGVPRTKICNPVEYFKDLEKEGLPKNRYVGELYFASHRGTYTSQAKTKRGNRKSEFAMREAEMWGTMAKAAGIFDYPYAEMDTVWKKVLLNQFHDILPGSSINRVYVEAEESYREILERAGKVANEAVSALVGHYKDRSAKSRVFEIAGNLPENKADCGLCSNTGNAERTGSGNNTDSCITVFNSLSWNRRELVDLPKGYIPSSTSGEPLPVQDFEDRVLAEVQVPSCGWTTICPSVNKPDVANCFKVNERLLENDLLRIQFNDKGEITSISDKETGWEFAAGLCNSFKMYKDVTNIFDAWDIDSMYDMLPVELAEKAEIKVICQGPLVAGIQVDRKINNSVLSQKIFLRKNSRRVDFKTTVDWQESHKLLKVAFPVNIHGNEGIHEIQFGHIRRPNHKSRQHDADRFEVCNHKWTALTEENRGFAVLNDSKYGVNVAGSSINLTLLKSALAPDMYADKGLQEFTYAFYLWNVPFSESNVIREAYELNSPVISIKGCGGEESIFSLDNPGVVIEAVKPAEDGSEDIIVRMYESLRTHARCCLETKLQVLKASQTNMLEKEEAVLDVYEGKIPLEFRPFEIKTVRLSLKK